MFKKFNFILFLKIDQYLLKNWIFIYNFLSKTNITIKINLTNKNVLSVYPIGSKILKI